mmetsp:Transcript_2873/g.4466  ORF Transcript_2873/g.4466 Transcript_2873/m.4466 type:complete len:217 (+) Transcript_2873:702-1352(+)
MDMTCWAESKVSSVIALFFIGWAISSLFIWFPDRVGRVRTMKIFCIPAAVIIMTCFIFFNGYTARRFLYMALGFNRIKMNLSVVTAIDHLQAKNKALAITFVYGLEGATVGLMCLYFQFVGRDAFSYLNYVNVIYFLTLLTTYFLTMESPKWLLLKSRQEEAIASLRNMAYINSHFTEVNMEGLQNVRIFLTQGDLDVYRREHDEEAKVKLTFNSA